MLSLFLFFGFYIRMVTVEIKTMVDFLVME